MVLKISLTDSSAANAPDGREDRSNTVIKKD
jgi:hypothetical protein